MLNYNYSLNQAQLKTSSVTPTSTPSHTPTISAASPTSLDINAGSFINTPPSSSRVHRRSNSVDFTKKAGSFISMNSNSTPPSSPISSARVTSTSGIPRKRSIIIDLDKVTEEYKNCERRLSVASAKIQNKPVRNDQASGDTDGEVDEDGEFYMRELELSCQLPLSSELLLQSYCKNEDGQHHSDDEELDGRHKPKKV
ncbi:uncharacterized protein SPAPADRAFT_63515, partial [Spathaspora passalidarum NRRL Y-27907]